MTRSDVHVRIPSANGLRKGDPVISRGVAVGEATIAAEYGGFSTRISVTVVP